MLPATVVQMTVESATFVHGTLLSASFVKTKALPATFVQSNVLSAIFAQSTVQPATLRAVADALASHTVVQPVYLGQRGHPVGFAASCRDALLALAGDNGARSVVQRYGAHLLPVDDAGCVHDVDTPQALEEARQRLA